MSKVTWATPPSCTNSAIDKAGREIVGDALQLNDNAIRLIEAWRQSFGFPLNTFQVNLRSRARRLGRPFVVGQRLKRFKSIEAKLLRGTIRLSTMQDIAGCRAVLESLDELWRLTEQYKADGCTLRNNYVQSPKPEGYRGIHFVGSYEGTGDQAQWNGRVVEIQLRTSLQHFFATAMETVTTFTGEPLKFGSGNDRWLRFFALMGTVIAISEGTPLVPGTPGDRNLIASELADLTAELNVIDLLNGWRTAMKRLIPSRHQTKKRPRSYVLQLDPVARTITSTPFVDLSKAARFVREKEQSIRQSKSRNDVVQVSTDSVKELRRAYPNYYADTEAFLGIVEAAIATAKPQKPSQTLK